MIEKNNNCQVFEYNSISKTFFQRHTTPKHGIHDIIT
jgi:hypothetical protein